MFPESLVDKIFGKGPPCGRADNPRNFYLFRQIFTNASTAEKKILNIRVGNLKPVWGDENILASLDDFLCMGGKFHLCLHNAIDKQGALSALKSGRPKFWKFLKSNKKDKNGQLKLSWWTGDEYEYRPHLIISSRDVCVIIGGNLGHFHFSDESEVEYWTKVFQERTLKESLFF